MVVGATHWNVKVESAGNGVVFESWIGVPRGVVKVNGTDEPVLLQDEVFALPTPAHCIHPFAEHIRRVAWKSNQIQFNSITINQL